MKVRARLLRPSNDEREMDLIERISRQFQDNTRTTLDALEMLAAPIAGAIEVMTSSLLDNGKILVCGGSGSSGDARRFAAQLVNGFELERPSLAAFALSADASTLPRSRATRVRQRFSRARSSHWASPATFSSPYRPAATPRASSTRSGPRRNGTCASSR